MKKSRKWFMVLQFVLSAAIIIMLFLGWLGICSKKVVNRADLSLLTGLLAVSAFRAFPERKKWIVSYVACSVCALFFLVISFL